jgi:hypothetical protein
VFDPRQDKAIISLCLASLGLTIPCGAESLEGVELRIHSPIPFHGVVLGYEQGTNERLPYRRALFAYGSASKISDA